MKIYQGEPLGGKINIKDGDFEAPIKWYAELGDFLMGWCRVFIK